MTVHLLGGCGSSGTTLLARILDGLHDLRSGPELAVFHHRALYGVGPGSEGSFRARVLALMSGQAWSVSMSVDRLQVPLVPVVFFQDRELYGVEGADAELAFLDASTDLSAMVRALKLGMARSLGAPGSPDEIVMVEQTPKNCVAALEYLEHGGPDARFVHLIRDGRDVAASLSRRWAREAPGHDPTTYVTAALARWTHDVTQGLRAEGHPGYLQIHYEDLVRDPEAEVGRILRHFGREPVDRQTLEQGPSPSAAAAGERFHGGSKPSWTLPLDGPISDKAVGRWVRDLDPRLVRAMAGFEFRLEEDETRYHTGELMQRLGYA